MSNIRVTYSGLIAFLVTILGVVTGTIFVIIVTRKLDPEDFGLWTLIGSIVTYVTIVEPIVTYWTTRQIARGEKIGKTSLFTSGLFSAGGVLVYFVIAIFVSFALGVDLFVLLLASALIPLFFVNNILNSICIGFRPQAVSYGLIAFETSKIPAGLIFVFFAQLGIIGVIITIIIANIIKMSILVILAKEQLTGSIKKESLKFWLRTSWLSLYRSTHGLIYKLDVLIFSLTTNSLVGLAFWASASAASNYVVSAGSISQGLYPKLIATKKNEYAIENLKRTLYFAIPILGATVVFAKPALHILNPFYIDGALIVIILGFRAFVNLLTGFFYNILESYESVDRDKKAPFRQYLKSQLFLVPTLKLAFSGIYVGILGMFLISVISQDLMPVEMVTNWAFIILITNIPFMIYAMIIVKKKFDIYLPFKEIIQYSSVTLLFSIIIYFISDIVLTYPDSIYDFLPQVIPLAILGGLIYFGITYVISNSVRIFFKSILKEMFKK